MSEEKQPPTQDDKARIQSTQAQKEGGGDKGFAGRIQSAADKAESGKKGNG